jgi:hypothetical protein
VPWAVLLDYRRELIVHESILPPLHSGLRAVLNH